MWGGGWRGWREENPPSFPTGSDPVANHMSLKQSVLSRDEQRTSDVNNQQTSILISYIKGLRKEVTYIDAESR